MMTLLDPSLDPLHGRSTAAPRFVTSRVVIPRVGTVEFVRDRGTSALLAVRGGGCDYLTVDDGVWRWHGICSTREELLADGMVRHVEAADGRWRERYRWDGAALVEIDGVAIRRDEDGRVIACLAAGDDPAPPTHRWHYGHDARGLVHVAAPCGLRSIALGHDGRPTAVREHGITAAVEYDRYGHRRAAARPIADHVDDAGRCWARMSDDGSVRHVFVWDGTRCLARIDGPVGAPLAAVFSLDPSATPVRVIEADRTIRIPRDAYGEGLLEHRGVPGLFGGQVHAGLVHLPLRRLDPRTGAFCEPDPWDGGDGDPRRVGTYEGPLMAEPEPRSPYEVCRGDAAGRADPTGGVSGGLIVSDLTWSLQNNVLSFFGIDWWFNLFGSLILSPLVAAGVLDYDFFSSTGLSASDRHGGFGVRRGGIINSITGGRAFTTQHIVWSPDSEYAVLEQGEVIDLGAAPVAFTHYGTVLAITPAGHPRVLLQSMRLATRTWATGSAGSLPGWTRHGGVGVPVAPGTLTPSFPTGGIHLDTALTDTRGDVSCTVAELAPTTVAFGDLDDRSFLMARSVTGLAAGDRALVSDGTALGLVGVIATITPGIGERIQLDSDLPGLGASGLTIVEASANPVSTNTHGAGAVADSLDVHGTSVTYAGNDLLRVVSGTDSTVARIARLEARLPLERALPPALSGPISITRGAIGAAATVVTMAAANLDFGGASRPAIGATGLVRGGGVDVAVRIESHTGSTEVVLDVALPATVTAAPTITFRPVTAGTGLGTRAEAAEADPFVTYTPTVAGAAPDGSTGTLVVRCDAGGQTHARVVSGAPLHDVIVVDRAIAGAAPFTVERFTTSGSTTTGLVRADVTALVVPDPAPFAAAPAVFLTKVSGSPPSGPALLASADVAGGVLTTTTSALAGPALGPSQPMMVGARAAAIAKLRVTVTVTGSFDLSTSGLRLVGLDANGHAYLGSVVDSDHVVVTPTVTVGAATVDVPFPRFLDGDLVRITDRAGVNPTWHRVASSSGGRLQLVDGPALTAGADIVVRHVVTPEAPTPTGGPLLGIDGTRGGTGVTSQATFSVWSTTDLGSDTPVGIVDGDVTHPTTLVNADRPAEITFSEPFDATAVPVSPLNRLADRFVTTLARDGGVLLLDGPVGDLRTQAGESVIAVAYTPGGTAVTATIGPGSLLVPEGEDTEVTRSQSLTDHELTHTLQYAQFGPLWFNIFPMLAMELPGILATDTELPEFSRFVDATTVAGPGGRWDITIPDLAGVAIAIDDELQVVQGSRRASVKVTSILDGVFGVHPVTGTAAPPSGQVSVRRKQKASTFDGFYAFFDLLTHGGILNVVAGSTWGGIFWLLGKAFYGLGRAIGGTGDLFAGTVQDGGGAITLPNEADATHIRTDGRIVVRQGDNTVVRSMTRSSTVITLTENVAFTGDVQVAMYDTHDPGSAFDWYDYYPATVDADNSFRLTIGAVGDDSLSLSPEDRITVKYRDANFNTDVIRVDGDAIEVSDPVNVAGDELSARVARVGASDPLGNADSTAMVEMGMGWMKWLFDPYGQIEYAAAPDQDWARWLLRVMRWLLGTQNFSLLPLGYLWWFRLFKGESEHTAFIEQAASQESGDLYSPLGRLYGQREPDGWARHKMVVGDIARYRYWTLSRGGTFVTMTRFDRPAAPDTAATDYTSQLRTMPNRDLAGAGTAPPNNAVEVGADPDPGTFVFEAFTVRDSDPRMIPGADPLGFDTSLLGNVPVGPRVERMQSAYVAFTRPGTHRATTTNNITGASEAVDVHDIGQQDIFHGGQTLFYDIAVSDVTVRVAGRTVDLTNPGTTDRLTMVPFQRADVAVEPNMSRVYEVAVPDPGGGVLGVAGSALIASAPSGAVTIPVEVSRSYAIGAGAYGPGGLAFAGMHLSRPVQVPVRRFSVEIVDTVPLLDAAEPDAAVLTSLAVGAAGFILVPAPIAVPPVVTSIGGNPPPPGSPDPISRVDAPDAVGLLGTVGSAFRIEFPAGSATGPVVVTVRVGTGATTADLTCTFALT